MFGSFVSMVFGCFLVIASFRLSMHTFRRLVRGLFVRLFPKRRIESYDFIFVIISAALFIVFEIIGIHRLIDPIVPGQAIINVHAENLIRNDREPYDLRVEITVANFGGSLDTGNVIIAPFDDRGIYSALIYFGWLQNRVQVRIFRQTNATKSIVLRWEHISICSRLGLTDKDIYIMDKSD
jgi:hypothetical protein